MTSRGREASSTPPVPGAGGAEKLSPPPSGATLSPAFIVHARGGSFYAASLRACIEPLRVPTPYVGQAARALSEALGRLLGAAGHDSSAPDPADVYVGFAEADAVVETLAGSAVRPASGSRIVFLLLAPPPA